MTGKQKLHAVVDTLPTDATDEDLQYALYIRQQIAAGLKDIKAGRVYDQAEFDRRMSKWLGKPAGRPKQRKTSTT
jgi:predicted transcriptional regulator